VQASIAIAVTKIETVDSVRECSALYAPDTRLGRRPPWRPPLYRKPFDHIGRRHRKHGCGLPLIPSNRINGSRRIRRRR